MLTLGVQNSLILVFFYTPLSCQRWQPVTFASSTMSIKPCLRIPIERESATTATLALATRDTHVGFEPSLLPL